MRPDRVSFEVTNGICSSVNVTGGTIFVEMREDIGDGGEIWTSLATKPIEGSNILLKNFAEMLSFVDGKEVILYLD
jgi:hypothetical protein